jgi:Holliday junction resolvase RusA-like endonuclease
MSQGTPEPEAPEHSRVFVVPGPPMGKPRMTQRDKWQKRPAVLRYRDYCDRIRAASKTLPKDVYGVIVQAHIAMPDSWSKKKKEEHCGTAHRQRPDWDNIAKSVGDALFKEDSVLAGGTCWKYWCRSGDERTVIRVLYDS